MNFIAIDFETANSNRSSICSIGIAVVENGRLSDTKHILVKPIPNHYESINTYIHGISDKDTRNERTFKEQWGELKKYFHNQIIVAHNAAFDCSALRSALDCCGLEYPDMDYHCTFRLSKETLPLYSHKLNDVSNHFRIALKHHNAESDAKASALIALKLCDQFKASSLKELSTHLGFKIGKIVSETKTYSAFSKGKVKKSSKVNVA